MTERFNRALPKILVHEGGFVNHPDDPGGATNKGVTQNTYNNWLRRHGKSQQSVRYISDDEVKAIYKEGYWDAVRADDLPDGVGYCVFDAAVNSGPGRAVRWLQNVIGARVDGVVGPETLGLTKQMDPTKLINEYCDKRLSFMKSLRHWSTFGRGWLRRVEEVRSQALEWVTSGQLKNSVVEAPGKADKAPQKPSQSGEVKGASTAGVGAVGVALSDAAEAIQPISQFSDTLRWVFVALIIGGAVWTIYSKLTNEEQ